VKTPSFDFSFWLAFLSVAASSALPAHGFGSRRSPSAPETHYLITLGDSISAGFLGSTQVDAVTPPMARALQKSAEPEPPFALQGIRYTTGLESKGEWSWATGSKSHSIATRLEAWLRSQDVDANRELRWLNQAESGAMATHLPRQARLAAESLRGIDPDRIALVTILIGANDVCQGNGSHSEEATMKADLLTALSRISALGGTRTRVFFSSIPNVPDLSQPEILQRPAEFGLTCKEVREKVVNFCPALLNWSTSAEYQAGSARVRRMNERLRSIADEARGRYNNLDIQFDSSLYELSIPSSQLAYDCFHPGRDGQKRIADLFWNAMGWFR
jgi:lysophospholipase L1-like esterase